VIVNEHYPRSAVVELDWHERFMRGPFLVHAIEITGGPSPYFRLRTMQRRNPQTLAVEHRSLSVLPTALQADIAAIMTRLRRSP
jgi:hypothetical protein